MRNLFPTGFFDGITDGIISGWSYDPDHPNSSNTIQIYIDGPAGVTEIVHSTPTDILREDVNDELHIDGAHGFKFAVPDKYLDGQPHSIYIYGIDSDDSRKSTLLIGTPDTFTLTDSPPTPSLIQVDGDPSDWTGIAPLLTDPAGDVVDDDGQQYPTLDIVNISVTNDATDVYFLVEFAGATTPDTLTAALLLLDTDQDPNTGCPAVFSDGTPLGAPGADYVVAFISAGAESFVVSGNLSDEGGDCVLTDEQPTSHGQQGAFHELGVKIDSLGVLSPTTIGFRIWVWGIDFFSDSVLPPATYHFN
jgi:hypothetical protein